MDPLNDTARRRYARNIALADIGLAGQQALLAARVLVVGAGGLGSPVITYLAAAGIGTIGVVDHDRVELSNLQRQILFETGDIGRKKTEAARDRVLELNPDVTLIPHALRLDDGNADTLIQDYDIVADGSDNFATRYAVNAACHRRHKPLISAAIRGFEGQVAGFQSYLDSDAPCYQCLVPDAPDDERGCRDAGILGAFAGVIGSLQALEVIKTILNLGDSLMGKVLLLNGKTYASRITHIPRDPTCPIHLPDAAAARRQPSVR